MVKADASTFVRSLTFPIYGLVDALHKPGSKNIVVPVTLFYAFVGLFSIYDGTGIDTERYAMYFLSACSFDGGYWSYHTSLAISNQIDFYTSFMTWFFSRFITSPHLFIAILSGVNGLFFSFNIKYILKNVNINRNTTILIILLILIPQAVFFPHRWWTAMQVFFFGVLPFVITGTKKYFWVSVASIFVHFSFLYIVILFLGYIFMPKKRLLLFLLLFIFTALLDDFDFNLITPYVERYFSEAQTERTIMYVGWTNGEKNFLSQSAYLFFKLSSIILFVNIYLKTNWKEKKKLQEGFIFVLLFASVTQILSLSPVGVRFKDFTNIIITVFLLLYFSNNKCPHIELIFRYCTPVFIYYIIYQIRGVLDCIGPGALVFGNFFDFFLIDETTSVLGYIKQLF
ncbi:EpsG family protein [Prevotella sp. E13-27]|uniref:EpsG family protein n=1 Tax=Prevotella sp. E13-27 TaxID=2938122 RepID=UPI00200B5664|nr:EpsG family protein [Prevotella sp. E13-27]MCK8623645.1 EpsG family protein [Prevotella sp. E13-27]